MTRYVCNRCLNKNFYHIRRDKLRCKNCLYEFKSRIANFNLTKKQWKRLIFWFILEQPIREIKKNTFKSLFCLKSSKTIKIDDEKRCT